MNKILYDAFYDPEQGMQSSNKLYQKLKDKGITLREVKQFIENQEAHQLNRQPVTVKHYFPITSTYENEIMQVDLADMSDVSTTNDYYKWLLCGIDAFTRKAYVIPLKNKTAISVTTGMKHILDNAVPHIVNCDNGSEFTSNEFKNLMKSNNIDVRYAPVGDHHKLGIVDRFIRTLRTLISNYQTAYNTTKYINVLGKLVKNYNNSYHSGIKGIPNEPDYERLIALTQDKYKKAIKAENTFKIGDQVRYMRNKALFEKGTTTAKWSATIHTVMEKTGHSYLLDNNRTYKYYELLPVPSVETLHIMTTRRKAKEPTKEQLKKTNTSKRRLHREGLAMSDIVNTKRTRVPINKYHY